MESAAAAAARQRKAVRSRCCGIVVHFHLLTSPVHSLLSEEGPVRLAAASGEMHTLHAKWPGVRPSDGDAEDVATINEVSVLREP